MGFSMNQKLEEQLQLALETPEEDRERTEDLNVGFDQMSRTWELIVKYHGSLEELEQLNVTVEYLLAGYALLTVPEGLVERVAEFEQIEYVEKPKRFFYEAVGPAEESCIAQVTLRDPFLSGRGVLIAVLDSGYRVIIMSSQRKSRKIKGSRWFSSTKKMPGKAALKRGFTTSLGRTGLNLSSKIHFASI